MTAIGFIVVAEVLVTVYGQLEAKVLAHPDRAIIASLFLSAIVVSFMLPGLSVYYSFRRGGHAKRATVFLRSLAAFAVAGAVACSLAAGTFILPVPILAAFVIGVWLVGSALAIGLPLLADRT